MTAMTRWCRPGCQCSSSSSLPIQEKDDETAAMTTKWDNEKSSCQVHLLDVYLLGLRIGSYQQIHGSSFSGVEWKTILHTSMTDQSPGRANGFLLLPALPRDNQPRILRLDGLSNRWDGRAELLRSKRELYTCDCDFDLLVEEDESKFRCIVLSV